MPNLSFLRYYKLNKFKHQKNREWKLKSLFFETLLDLFSSWFLWLHLFEDRTLNGGKIDYTGWLDWRVKLLKYDLIFLERLCIINNFSSLSFTHSYSVEVCFFPLFFFVSSFKKRSSCFVCLICEDTFLSLRFMKKKKFLLVFIALKLKSCAKGEKWIREK